MQTIAAAAPFLSIAASGFGAIGAIRQGNATASAARYNANLADQNASIARANATENARRQRVQNYKALGAIRANVGASGVELDGSPLDVIEESARTAELDALTVQYQGDLQAWGYDNSAALYRRSATQAVQGGYWGAAAALLKGGAGFASDRTDAPPTQQLLKYRSMANRAYENPDI